MPLSADQRAVENIRALYGDEEAAETQSTMIMAPPPEEEIRDELEAPLLGMVPRVTGSQPIQPGYIHKEEITEWKIEAVKTETKNIERKYGVDKATAAYMAREKVESVINEAKDVHGREMPLASRKDIEALSGLEAVWEAQKPQVIKPAEDYETQQERVARARAYRQDLLDGIDKQIPAVYMGEDREKEKTRRLHEQLEGLKESNVERARVLYEQIVGEPPQNEGDVLFLGHKMWMDFIKPVAPELYKQERTYWDAAVDTVSPVLKRAMQRVTEVEDESFEPGTTVETYFSTFLRDLTGTLRVAVDPYMQWTTWEMDENGEPRNPEDFAYFIWDKVMWEGYKERPWITGSTGLPIIPLPFQPSTRTSLDQDNPALESSDMMRDIAVSMAEWRPVGDDLMDLPIYQEQWEKLGYPNMPWWVGMALEIGIPITAPVTVPIAGVKATAKTAAAGARFTERMAHGTALANGASKAAQVAEAVVDPMVVLRDARASRLAQEVLHGLPSANTFEGTKDAAETSRKVAAAVADEVVLPQVALRHVRTIKTKYVDPDELGTMARSSVVRKAVADSVEPTQYKGGRRFEHPEAKPGRIVRDRLIQNLSAHVGKAEGLAQSGKMHRVTQRAMAVGAKSIKADQPVSPVTAQISRTMELLAKEMPGARAIDIEAQAMADVAANSVRTDLLDMAPRLYGETILMGRMLLTKKAWDRVGVSVTDQVVKILEHDVVGDLRHFKEPVMVAEQLVRALGGRVVNQSAKWTKVVETLRNKGPLHTNDYYKIHSEIQGKIIRKEVAEAPELQWAGRAWAAAREPLERRIQPYKTAQEIFEHVTVEAVELGKKALPKLDWDGVMETLARPKGSIFNYDVERTPAAMAEALEGMNAKLINVVTDLENESIALQKGYRAQGLSRKAAAAKAGQHQLDEAVESIATTIEGQTKQIRRDTNTFLAWVDVAGKFFGPGISQTDIKTALGLSEASVEAGTLKGIPKLTGERFAEFVADIRKGSAKRQRSGLKTTNLPWIFQKDVSKSDDIFAALTGFITEQRAQKMVRAEYQKVLDLSPGLRINLYHPLETGSDEMLSMIKGRLKDYLPERTTPNIVEIVDARVRLMDQATTRLNNSLAKGTLPKSYEPAIKQLRALRDLVAKGWSLSDDQLKLMRHLMHKSRLGKEAAWFQPAGTPMKMVDENDAIARVANRLLRDLSEMMTSDQRVGLARQALERKIASGNLYAQPVDVAQMQGAFGQHLKDRQILLALRRVGVSEEAIPAATKAIKDVVWRTIGGTADEQIQGLLRTWGFTAGAKVTEVPSGMAMKIMEIPAGDDVVMMYGPDQAEIVARLQKAVVSGGLDEALESIRYTGDERLLDHFTKSVQYWWMATKRTTISGMLGGVVLPITRFHGLNFFSAPAIAAATTGWRGMKMAAGVDLKTNSLANWAAMRFGARPDDVIFVSDTGIKWTRRGVQEAIERNNVRFSQVTYEFHPVVLKDIARTMKLDRNMEAVGRSKQVMRWIDPRNKGFWNQVAEATDNYWRKNIFTAALKEGRTEAAAAKLAQTVLLDYGAIPAAERAATARWVLFYAFRRQMLAETVRSGLKGGNTLRQMAVWHHYQHESSKSWAYSRDWEKVRMYQIMGPVFDKVAKSGIYGPGNPALEGFNDVANVTGWVLNPTFSGVWEGAKDVTFTPELRFLQEMIDYGPDEKAAGYVPPHHVAAMMEFGCWPWFQNAFDVQAIDMPPEKKERRRIGDPTFYGQQFKFGNTTSYNKYKGFIYAMTKLGMMRTMDDYVKLAIAAGHAPEGAELKYLGTPNPMLVAGNLQTPLKLNDEQKTRLRQYEEVLRELKSMSSQETP